MKKTAVTRINKHLLNILIFTGIITVLYLSSLNISNYISKEKVLGVTTISADEGENVDETKFWLGFLQKHPTYIPGWIEIGRLDKVREIDPNYQIR